MSDQTSLPHLRAVRYVVPLREGGSLPAVVEAGPIFKLVQMPRGKIYLSGTAVDALLGSGLSGLEFEKVWSSDA